MNPIYLSSRIRESFEQHRNDVCLVAGSAILKYRDVWEKILEKAEFFWKCGIREGDVLTLSYKSNALDLIYSILSTLCIGAKCCIIPPPHQQGHIDNNLLGQWFLTEGPFHADHLRLAASSGQYFLYGMANYRKLPKEFDKTWLILPTSGTTGCPKWIFLSESGVLETVASIQAYMNTGPEDVFFALKHLGHISSITSDLLLSLLSGGKLIVNMSDFKLRSLAAQIKNNRVTVLTLVPTILNYLIKENIRNNMESVRAISLVGAPAPRSLLIEANHCLPQTEIFIGYGLTEASSRVTYLPPKQFIEKIGSIGKPIDGITVKLFRNNEEITTAHTIGEIAVRGPGVMVGYWDGTDYVVHQDEFLPTNDLAYFDNEGFYYHRGRKDDVMIINGVNVSAIELEEKITQLDAVEACVVFKDGSARDFDKITALIELKPGTVVNEKEIYIKMQAVLPISLMPKIIKIIDKIPVESNGKISRRVLQNHFGIYGDA